MDYSQYTSHSDEPDLAGASAKKGGRSKLLYLWLLLSGVLVAFGITYWIASAFPDKIRNLLIAVDRFGITEIGAAEQNRANTINTLTITYEEKQVLINRTVFFGASRDMVTLALGKPVCVRQSAATENAPATEFWVYYIEDDRKPTQLAFQGNELISAQKSSALDTCK